MRRAVRTRTCDVSNRADDEHDAVADDGEQAVRAEGQLERQSTGERHRRRVRVARVPRRRRFSRHIRFLLHRDVFVFTSEQSLEI